MDRIGRSALGSFLVAASAVGFGSLPFFALAAYSRGVTVSTLLAVRFAIAAVVFFVYGAARGEGSPSTLGRDVKPLLVVLGALYCVHSSLYLRSVKLIPPAMAALIFYSYPALVTLASSLLNRERISRRLAGSVAISSFGLVLVLGAAPGGLNRAGITLAACTSVAYSTYILVSNRVVHQLPSHVTSAYVSAVASVLLFTLGYLGGDVTFHFEAAAWGPIVGLTLCASVLGMFGLFKGIELIGPSRSSILSMVEPVVTSGLGVLLLRQALTPVQMLGGLAVLMGALMVSLRSPDASVDAAERVV